jgi:hypothetical protein
MVEARSSAKGQTYAAELGIDLERNTPAALYCWWCAAILLSARISAPGPRCRRKALAGWTMAQKMARCNLGATHPNAEPGGVRAVRREHLAQAGRYRGNAARQVRRRSAQAARSGRARSGARARCSWSARASVRSAQTSSAARRGWPGTSCSRSLTGARTRRPTASGSRSVRQPLTCRAVHPLAEVAG